MMVERVLSLERGFVAPCSHCASWSCQRTHHHYIGQVHILGVGEGGIPGPPRRVQCGVTVGAQSLLCDRNRRKRREGHLLNALCFFDRVLCWEKKIYIDGATEEAPTGGAVYSGAVTRFTYIRSRPPAPCSGDAVAVTVGPAHEASTAALLGKGVCGLYPWQSLEKRREGPFPFRGPFTEGLGLGLLTGLTLNPGP